LDPGCKTGQQLGVPFVSDRAAVGTSTAPLRLRAVDITLDDTTTSANDHGHKWYGATDAADGAGGPAALPAAAALVGKAPAGTLDHGRGSTRSFGNPEGGSWKKHPGGAEVGGGGCEPVVRRMKLKSEDLFIVLGTSGLWSYLSPDDAVAIVSQGLHLMAADSARALRMEALRRAALARAPPGYISGHYANQHDITAVVVYLAGARYVSDFSVHRADHVPEHLRHIAAVRHLQPHACPVGLWCGGSTGPVLAGGC